MPGCNYRDWFYQKVFTVLMFVFFKTQKDDMTVLVKKAKSVTHSKDVTKSREKTAVGLKADEMNEFNMQTNKERKKVMYA